MLMPLLQLSASAGSGKTHRLSREFVKLCLRSAAPEAVSGLIAMTFTNKATAEMKERILHLLFDLSQVKDMADIQHESFLLPIARDLGLDGFKNRAHQTLRYLLKNYHLFSISTIDSFFQKIISLFQRELHLMHELKIELDQDIILYKAVDHLIEHLQPSDEAFLWILRWVESTMDEDKSWDFRNQLRTRGNDLFKEGVIDRWSDEPDWQSFYEVKDQMEAFCKEVDQTIEASRDNLQYILDHNGLTIADFKGGQKGPIQSLLKCKSLENVDSKINLIERLLNKDTWTPKASVSSDVEDQLVQLFDQLGIIYHQKRPKYIAYKAVSKNFYAYLTLRFLYHALLKVAKEEDVLLISESSRLVNQVIKDADDSLLYEKTGQRYRHLMVDEFQDTSSAQWENLVPLFVNAMSEGQECLVVGDIKQAIYRFRNGDWRIMHEGIQKGLSSYTIKLENLEDNWRSSRSIVEFNNTFFPAFIQFLKGKEELNHFPAVYKDTLDLLYDSVAQNPRKPKGFEGSVELYVLTPTDESNPRDEEETSVGTHYLEWLDEVLSRAYDANFTSSDIAILVRNNKEVRTVLTYLEILQQRKPKGDQFVGISDGGFLLKHSKLIQLLIAVLNLKTYPANDYLLPLIEHFWQEIHGEDSKAPLLFKREHQLPEPIQIALHTPIHTLTEWFFQCLKVWQLTSYQAHYVFAFMDLVRQFELNEGGDAELFLEWWEDRGVKRGLSSGSDQSAIQVMTIHKSKGLQFPIVILPFLEADVLTPSTRTEFYVSDETDPILSKLGSFPLTYTKLLMESSLKDFVIQEQFMHLVDNLNLMYVAFTRPEQQLILGIEFPKLSDKGEVLKKNIASNLILASLGFNDPQRIEPYFLLKGDPNCKKSQTIHKEGNTSSPVFIDEVNVRQYTLTKGIWRERPLPLSDMSDQTAKRRGVIMHRIMEVIQGPGHLDAALQLCIEEGLLKDLELEAIKLSMTQFLAMEEVAGWFDPKWKIYKEHSIINVDGKVYRPDRVLVSQHATLLIDYKTGAERKEYIKQMEQYKSLLKAMGLPHVSGILAFVDKQTLVHC
jgi:ATP-dependent helicase/nuclease subunit A